MGPEAAARDANVTRSDLSEAPAGRMVTASESIPVLSDQVSIERRRDVRVVANGSVVVHGGVSSRGRLSNVSSSGMHVRLAEGEPCSSSGEQVGVELHLDRAGATWLQFRGEIVRAGEREVAIHFTAVPLDFVDVIQDALTSVLEGTAVAHVLLVDGNTDRRVPFAALLRKAGCRVAEAATPLEAIAHLGGSAIERWMVVITDTLPTSIADELRRFLADSDAPPFDIVALGEQSQTSALAWFAAIGRGPRGAGSRSEAR
ncbi:MAG TPA: PilZ domain-containing protein [Kofleriaceae bacterium]